MSVYPAALPTVRPAVRSAFEQGSGGGAASIIAGLFAQGQQGFWLPFTDFDSLSQDSAGTLPYTALEQPVGRVLDRSGRGNHASQATSTARGKVSAAVVLPPTRPYYLQLDGVDDFYTCGGGGSTTGFFYSDVVRPMSAQYAPLISNEVQTGATSGWVLQRVPTGFNLVVSNNGSGIAAVATTPAPLGELAFVQAWDDGASIYLQVNDTVNSIPRPASIPAGPSTISLYKYNTLTQYFNGQVTEPIYRAGPPPSAYERSVIRGYQMQKAGL